MMRTARWTAISIALAAVLTGSAAAAVDPDPADPAAQAAQAAEPSDAPAVPEMQGRRPRDSGFYLGLAGSAEFLELEFDDRAAIGLRDIQWEDWGGGGAFIVGYNFGPRFRAEATLGGSGRATTPGDARSGYAVVRVTGFLPLFTNASPFQPHLIAGFSGVAPYFHTEGEKDLAYFAGAGELGAGVRAILSPRWSLQVDFIHSIVDIEQEMVEAEDGKDTELRNVGREGRIEALRIAFIRDF